MKTFGKLAICVLGLLALGLGVAATGSAQDTAALAGQWKPVSGTLHGQAVPGTALQAMNLMITGTTFNASSGSLSSAGTITPTAGSADQATFIITTGSDANRQLFAKWKSTGNQMTIVFSEQGPPVDFNSTAANKYLVLTYDRSTAGGVTGGVTGTVGAGGTGSGAGIE